MAVAEPGELPCPADVGGLKYLTRIIEGEAREQDLICPGKRSDPGSRIDLDSLQVRHTSRAALQNDFTRVDANPILDLVRSFAIEISERTLQAQREIHRL